jgi:hypothetical protein
MSGWTGVEGIGGRMSFYTGFRPMVNDISFNFIADISGYSLVGFTN